MRSVRAIGALAIAVCAAACRDRDAPIVRDEAAAAESPHKRELLRLYDFEERRLHETDFATLPPSDLRFGPDPYRIAALRDGRQIGVLRGESAVVVLDGGVERARVAGPPSASAIAVSAEGDVLVAGDGARELVQLRVDPLATVATLPIDALGIRDVAFAPDGKTAYVIEERLGRLLAVTLDRDRERTLRAAAIRELGRCHGPIQVAAAAGYVATNCLLDHAIEIRRGADVARIQHDGPLWSFALRRDADGGLLVAAGGVEDHPLVREDGGFGYVDSYVYLYRLPPGATHAQRLAAIDVSELGVVTPKWIAFRDGALAVTTAAYGSAVLLTLTWPDGKATGAPVVTRAELPPGTAAATIAGDGTLVAANPLLDAWVLHRGGEARVVPIATALPSRSMPSRIGELLFFTTLMAPWNSAEGALSRFTCETCHHEGYVDGRVHFTGRGDVHVTTRPLYGLFNNRPYFSRALDATMTQMVHSEFRVANRHNGRDPWFALTHADVPWSRAFGVPAQISPELLRESFMTFLMDFTHRANPAADHARFTAVERAGAQLFRDRCASCHAAQLIADDPASTVPFERWESLVLSPAGPIVWSNAAYAKTGVVPYVHESGTRVPTLRRLYKKWPYFTNGSASTLAEVLDRFASGSHDHAPPDAARLNADDKRALLAFLDLL